jgi:hypothetical protein
MQFQFSVILLPSYMYPGLDNSAAWRLGADNPSGLARAMWP